MLTTLRIIQIVILQIIITLCVLFLAQLVHLNVIYWVAALLSPLLAACILIEYRIRRQKRVVA